MLLFFTKSNKEQKPIMKYIYNKMIINNVQQHDYSDKSMSGTDHHPTSSIRRSILSKFGTL